MSVTQTRVNRLDIDAVTDVTSADCAARYTWGVSITGKRLNCQVALCNTISQKAVQSRIM